MSARSRQLSAYVMSFCLTLVACGGGDDDAADPQPTTTSPSTTQSQEQADEQALRQLAEDWYEAIRLIYDEGADPEIAADYLVDPYLGGFIDQVEEYRAGTDVIESSPESAHEVRSIQVDGESAVVVECVVDADVRRAADGTVVDDSVVAKVFSTTATRSEAGWRLQERKTLTEQEGTECAAS